MSPWSSSKQAGPRRSGTRSPDDCPRAGARAPTGAFERGAAWEQRVRKEMRLSVTKIKPG